MEIRRHKACTHDLGAPADMQDGSCLPLPVAHLKDQHGIWAVSFWRPSPAELADLLANGSVALLVRVASTDDDGASHPVVAMTVTPEPTEPV